MVTCTFSRLRFQSSDSKEQPIGEVQSVRAIQGRNRHIPKAFEIFTADDKAFVLKAASRRHTEEWVQCLSIALARTHASTTRGGQNLQSGTQTLPKPSQNSDRQTARPMHLGSSNDDEELQHEKTARREGHPSDQDVRLGSGREESDRYWNGRSEQRGYRELGGTDASRSYQSITDLQQGNSSLQVAGNLLHRSEGGEKSGAGKMFTAYQITQRL